MVPDLQQDCVLVEVSLRAILLKDVLQTDLLDIIKHHAGDVDHTLLHFVEQLDVQDRLEVHKHFEIRPRVGRVRCQEVAQAFDASLLYGFSGFLEAINALSEEDAAD